MKCDETSSLRGGLARRHVERPPRDEVTVGVLLGRVWWMLYSALVLGLHRKKWRYYLLGPAVI